MRIIFLCAIISFIVTLIATPQLIRYLYKTRTLVKDMNKKDKKLVPLSGGIAVMGGVFVGLMCFVFEKTFLFKDYTYTLNIFTAVTTILLITFIGFIDDSIIKKNKDRSLGLKQWQKPLLTLVASIPLVVINAGTTTMSIPFLGLVNFGLFYSLILVPVGVVGAANMVNMLAGVNGIETGMGIIYTGMLGVYAYFHQSYAAAAIAFTTFGALLAFYKFNKFPSRIFPGDSLTYLLGAVLACIAIIGNIEKAVFIASIPFLSSFY